MEDERIVLRDFPVELSADDLREFMRKKGGNDIIEEYADIARDEAKPKIILKWVSCDVTDEHTAVIGGVSFDSVLLANKLKNLHRVILYVCTAGNEIKESDSFFFDMEKDIVSGAVLSCALRTMNGYLKDNFSIDNISYLNPGSIPDWPIENNFDICRLIGDVEKDAGVTLTPQGYMNPWNSSSGIVFSDDSGYMNCKICKKFDCIGRRAPFDKNAYADIFGREA